MISIETPRKRLIILRRINNYTQKQAARLLTISPRRYQRIEHGESSITIEDLIKAANVYAVPPGFFVTDPATAQRDNQSNLSEAAMSQLIEEISSRAIRLKSGRDQIPIAENHLDRILVNDAHINELFLDKGKLKYTWQEVFSSQEAIVGYFERVIRSKARYIMCYSIADEKKIGRRHSLSIGYVDKRSWDNPVFASSCINITKLDGINPTQVSQIWQTLQKQLGQEIALVQEIR